MWRRGHSAHEQLRHSIIWFTAEFIALFRPLVDEQSVHKMILNQESKIRSTGPGLVLVVVCRLCVWHPWVNRSQSHLLHLPVKRNSRRVFIQKWRCSDDYLRMERRRFTKTQNHPLAASQQTGARDSVTCSRFDSPSPETNKFLKNQKKEQHRTGSLFIPEQTQNITSL